MSGKHSLLPTPRKHTDLMSSAVSGVVSTCELSLQMGKYLNSAMPSCRAARIYCFGLQRVHVALAPALRPVGVSNRISGDLDGNI